MIHICLRYNIFIVKMLHHSVWRLKYLKKNFFQLVNFFLGPKWWPFIGNTSLLRNLSKKLKGQHLALSKLAQEYNTSVLGLKLGKDLVVVVFTAPVVKEVLTRDEFIGRPDTYFLRLRCFGSRRGK